MHDNKHNGKKKVLCSLNLRQIYLFCHCPGQATCIVSCGASAWDWDMPPHFGIGLCKQMSTDSFERAEGKVKSRLYLRMAA